MTVEYAGPDRTLVTVGELLRREHSQENLKLAIDTYHSLRHAEDRHFIAVSISHDPKHKEVSPGSPLAAIGMVNRGRMEFLFPTKIEYLYF